MNSRGQCFSRAKKSYRRSEQREEVTILEVQVTKRGVRGLRHGRSGLTAIASTVDYFSRRGSDKYVHRKRSKIRDAQTRTDQLEASGATRRLIETPRKI